MSLKTGPDPDLYREISLPFNNEAEAHAALDAFFEDVRLLRAKHRIADVSIIAELPYRRSDVEGGESATIASMHFGDALKAQMLAAYLYGAAVAEHQAMIESIVSRATKQKR